MGKKSYRTTSLACLSAKKSPIGVHWSPLESTGIHWNPLESYRSRGGRVKSSLWTPKMVMLLRVKFHVLYIFALLLNLISQNGTTSEDPLVKSSAAVEPMESLGVMQPIASLAVLQPIGSL